MFSAPAVVIMLAKDGINNISAAIALAVLWYVVVGIAFVISVQKNMHSFKSQTNEAPKTESDREPKTVVSTPTVTAMHNSNQTSATQDSGKHCTDNAQRTQGAPSSRRYDFPPADERAYAVRWMKAAKAEERRLQTDQLAQAEAQCNYLNGKYPKHKIETLSLVDDIKLFLQEKTDLMRKNGKADKLGQLWYRLGFLYSELHQFDEAIQSYGKGFEILRACRASGTDRYQYMLEKVERIRKATEKIEGSSGSDKAQAYVERAFIPGVSHWNAIEDLQAAWEGGDNIIEVQFFHGVKFFERQQFEAAIRCFTRILDQKADETDTYYRRGECYRYTRQYEKALADFSAAIAHDKDDYDAISQRALIYRLLGRYDEAAADKAAYEEMSDVQYFGEAGPVEQGDYSHHLRCNGRNFYGLLWNQD